MSSLHMGPNFWSTLIFSIFFPQNCISKRYARYFFQYSFSKIYLFIFNSFLQNWSYEFLVLQNFYADLLYLKIFVQANWYELFLYVYNFYLNILNNFQFSLNNYDLYLDLIMGHMTRQTQSDPLVKTRPDLSNVWAELRPIFFTQTKNPIQSDPIRKLYMKKWGSPS